MHEPGPRPRAGAGARRPDGAAPPRRQDRPRLPAGDRGLDGHDLRPRRHLARAADGAHPKLSLGALARRRRPRRVHLLPPGLGLGPGLDGGLCHRGTDPDAAREPGAVSASRPRRAGPADRPAARGDRRPGGAPRPTAVAPGSCRRLEKVFAHRARAGRDPRLGGVLAGALRPRAHPARVDAGDALALDPGGTAFGPRAGRGARAGAGRGAAVGGARVAGGSGRERRAAAERAAADARVGVREPSALRRLSAASEPSSRPSGRRGLELLPHLDHGHPVQLRADLHPLLAAADAPPPARDLRAARLSPLPVPRPLPCLRLRDGDDLLPERGVAGHAPFRDHGDPDALLPLPGPPGPAPRPRRRAQAPRPSDRGAPALLARRQRPTLGGVRQLPAHPFPVRAGARLPGPFSTLRAGGLDLQLPQLPAVGDSRGHQPLRQRPALRGRPGGPRRRVPGAHGPGRAHAPRRGRRSRRALR